jgi:hypothetical protein
MAAPKSTQPQGSDLRSQSSEAAKIIPIVYGTARVAGNILERGGPWLSKQGAPPGIAVGTPGVEGRLNTQTYAIVPDGAPYEIKLDFGYAFTRFGWWTASGAYPGVSAVLDRTTGVAVTSDKYSIANGIVTFDASLARHAVAVFYEITLEGGTGNSRPGYQFELAIGLCEGAISSVKRAWVGKLSYPVLGAPPVNGFVVTTSTTTFASNITGQPDGYFNGYSLAFTSGPLSGASRTVSSYASGTFVLSSALPSIPAAGSTFTVRSVNGATLASQTVTTTSFSVNVADRADGYFAGGLLLFTSGGASGMYRLVKSYKAGGDIEFTAGFDGANPQPQAGDTFTLYTGYAPSEFDVLSGTAPQTRPAWKVWTGEGIVGSDTYPNTACVFVRFSTGSDSNLPEMSWEVAGPFSSAVDANPADIITDLFTHARRGSSCRGSSTRSAPGSISSATSCSRRTAT